MNDMEVQMTNDQMWGAKDETLLEVDGETLCRKCNFPVVIRLEKGDVYEMCRKCYTVYSINSNDTNI